MPKEIALACFDDIEHASRFHPLSADLIVLRSCGAELVGDR
jgi:hypothetical protein